jgi:UDP-N-acetylmuramyl pentapeptide phosphotransferase/UDP-N-acetylglucosamine-1-phosphate transferase
MPLSQYLAESSAIFSIALLVAFLTTPLSIRWGARAGLLDYPNERRIHPRTVARSGGLALVLGFYSGAACIYLFLPYYQGELGSAWLRAFFLASLVVIATGLYDDRKGLRAEYKLLGQLFAAALMYFLTGQSFGSILGYALPSPLDFLLTLFWFLAITNAFNLIDGLDGLCAGITAISALGLGVSFIIRDMPSDSLACFALAGAALGFLYYNFHPAKVFLGDTGSMFCGFCLAAMALQTNGKSTLLITVGIPVLASGIPVMDTILAIWRRSARSMLARSTGDKNATGLLHADLEHIHHRLLALGLSQRQVALILYLATLFCVILGLLSVLGSKTNFGLFLIIFTACVYVLIRHVVHVELWDTGKLVLQHIGNKSSKRGFVSLFFYPLWDLAWLAFSFGISFWLVTSLTVTPFIFLQWLGQLLIWLPCPYVALIIGNTYYKVWFHATNKDYLELALALISGTLLSIGIRSLLQQDINFFAAVVGLLFCLFSLLGVIGIRGAAPVFRDWMLTTKRFRQPAGDRPLQQVLLYGAGRRCGLFMREQHLASYRETEAIRVAGIIDDAPFLRKRLIYGLRVIGGLDELESALDALHIDRVIVTIDLNTEKLERLKRIAARKNFELYAWRSKLYPL